MSKIILHLLSPLKSFFIVNLCLMGLNTPSAFCLEPNLQYQMEDIAQLAKNKNFSEFFIHVKDILPSKRQDSWKKLLKGTFKDYLISLKLTENLDDQKMYSLADLYSWPEILKDEEIHQIYDQLVLKYLESTILPAINPTDDQVNSWQKLTRKLKQEQTKTPINSFKMTQAYNQISERWIKLGWENKFQILIFPYLSLQELMDHELKSSINGGLSHLYCQEPFVQEYILQKILAAKNDIKSNSSKSENPIAKWADKACWQNFKPYLVGQIDHLNTEYQELFIHLLTIDEKNNPKQIALLHLLYLLNSPTPSTLFNQAWGTLKELSFNAQRRDELLEYFSKLEPFTDSIWGEKDWLKKKTILEEFNKNFPELMSLYTKRCKNYLEGLGQNSRGNPTPHCKDFYYLLGSLSEDTTLKVLKDKLQTPFAALPTPPSFIQ